MFVCHVFDALANLEASFESNGARHACSREPSLQRVPFVQLKLAHINFYCLLCVLKYVCVWCVVRQSPEAPQGLESGSWICTCVLQVGGPARLYTEGTGYTGNFTLSPILAIPEYHKREIANFSKIRALSHT